MVCVSGCCNGADVNSVRTWRYANIVGAAIEVERVGGKQSGFDMVTHSKAT